LKNLYFLFLVFFCLQSQFLFSNQADTLRLIWGYSHIPLTADSVVNVYDFILHDVPSSHMTNDWIVKLTDVWGYTVEGQLSTTNIQDIINPSNYFNAYPNPSFDYLTLEYGGSFESNIINIINNQGQLMITKELENSGEIVDISKLSSGIYLVSFNDIIIKIIKN
jgi:hypothetical protein